VQVLEPCLRLGVQQHVRRRLGHRAHHRRSCRAGRGPYVGCRFRIARLPVR
jgi:hypothetical protein